MSLELAAEQALRSNCSRRQVGAVLVDRFGSVVGRGTNGMEIGSCSGGDCPRGRLTYAEQPPDVGYTNDTPCHELHAEERCVLRTLEVVRFIAPTDVMYITHQPCPNCMRFIKGAGVRAARWPGGGYGDAPGG